MDRLLVEAWRRLRFISVLALALDFEHRALAVPQFLDLSPNAESTYILHSCQQQWRRTCQSPFNCFSSSSFYWRLPAASSHKVDQAPARTILCRKSAHQSPVEGAN